MRLFGKMLVMIVSTVLLCVPLLNVSATEFNLPEEIKMEKENFDLLKTLTQTNTTVYTQQVNNKEDRIQSIAIAENLGAVSGETVIKLTPEIARVVHFFFRLDLHGTDLTNLKVKVKTSGGEKDLTIPWRTEKIIQGRAQESFIVPQGNTELDFYEGWEVIITGTGNIDRVILFEQNGLPTSYDVKAYGVLGGDKPILDVNVSLDVTKRLEIEGVTEFENRKFKNLGASPISIADGYLAADYYINKDFTPGREIMKFYNGLEHAHWMPNYPLMTEDANNEGYADYSFFDEYYKRDEKEINEFDKYYHTDMEFVTCYNHWPSWNWAEGATGNNSNGTPAVEYFTQAADLAAKYTLAIEEKRGNRSPTWIEVKNEATISSNWNHHNDPTVDSWQLLADFHNLVATEIKKVSPNTLVGGPTAAWMAFDADNFDEARRNLKFLDDTKGYMDFYSYHFYENIDLLVHDTESRKHLIITVFNFLKC